MSGSDRDGRGKRIAKEIHHAGRRDWVGGPAAKREAKREASRGRRRQPVDLRQETEGLAEEQSDPVTETPGDPRP